MEEQGPEHAHAPHLIRSAVDVQTPAARARDQVSAGQRAHRAAVLSAPTPSTGTNSAGSSEAPAPAAAALWVATSVASSTRASGAPPDAQATAQAALSAANSPAWMSASGRPLSDQPRAASSAIAG